jgi:protease YdgD
MRDSPSLNRNSNVIRALSAGFGLAILLTGCATTAPAPKLSIGPTASWTAAIGELDTGGDGPHCTAVLVAPDIIASAAHCLFLNGSQAPVSPYTLVFRPNQGGLPALPPARGTLYRALGGIIRGGPLPGGDASRDWVLIGISPPVIGVQPVPVAGLSVAGMLEMVKSGDRLVTAGYGNGDYQELRLHAPCRIIPQAELGMHADDRTVITSCIFQLGDSGGPILLMDGAGQPALVAVIAGLATATKGAKQIGLGANAGNFLPFLQHPTDSQGVPEPGTQAAED